MRWLSKLLVLVAVMAAAGYTIHRIHTCQIAFVPASLLSSVPNAESQVGGSTTPLLYPTPRVEAQLKLGYKTLETRGDGTFTVVPMPPQSALSSTLQLETAGHATLRATLADSKCGSAVELAAYRPDQAKPILSTELSTHQQRMVIDIDVSGNIYPGLVLVTMKMADGAANNWWCGVSFAWDPAR
jgi:hypothetical protein